MRSAYFAASARISAAYAGRVAVVSVQSYGSAGSIAWLEKPSVSKPRSIAPRIISSGDALPSHHVECVWKLRFTGFTC